MWPWRACGGSLVSPDCDPPDQVMGVTLGSAELSLKEGGVEVATLLFVPPHMTVKAVTSFISSFVSFCLSCSSLAVIPSRCDPPVQEGALQML